ncbi:MAG: polysaccharide deacetylase family protein, partial [Peptococcaceae bacterium]|nr:polysaccharide deacetylase family protein [Peptococcaceae bacterium]
MRYKTMTRGFTILVMLFALLIMFAGWVMEQMKPDAAETGAGEARLVPIYFVEMDEKKLAISFDAAWGCERTEIILDILKKYNVKATFFLTNIWLDDYPDMARKIADAGHEIAMHSVSHPHMPQLSKAEMQKELDGNAQKIQEVT